MNVHRRHRFDMVLRPGNPVLVLVVPTGGVLNCENACRSARGSDFVVLLSMSPFLRRALRRGPRSRVDLGSKTSAVGDAAPPGQPTDPVGAAIHTPSAAPTDDQNAALGERIGARRLTAIAGIGTGERVGGRLPELGVAAALGLLIVAGAHALSRSGHGGGETLFWLSILAPIALAALRLSSLAPSRRERLGIVVLLGMTLYLVKVLKDPFTFLHSDEFVHAYNAQRVLDGAGLFGENPLLPVTAHYPGLASVTSAVASVTGLHVFGAGLIVVGSARLLMLVALFLLFEDVSGSARVAGLGTLIYLGHPNFIFFTGQYAYESLALPLAVFAIASVSLWGHRENEPARRGWAVAALLVITALAATHHLTAYALCAFLVAVSAVHRFFVRQTAANPWPFALFALVAIVAWLIFVATDTAGYLTVIFGRALEDTIRTLSLESAPRELFRSPYGSVAPIGESAVALASVALIAVLLPLAVRETWRRYRRNPFAIVFAGAAGAYMLVLFLRFVPGAWEVANRASAFLFLGVAFMLSLAIKRALPFLPKTVGQGAVAGAVALLVAGGLVAGWPRELRLSLPYWIEANGKVLEPEGASAARWSSDQLGTGVHLLADPSNARLALAEGQFAFAGGSPNLNDILRNEFLDPWMVTQIRRIGARYVVVDRRRIADDHTYGNYFTSTPAERAGFYPASSNEKFERQPGVSKVYDSGDIAIYDLDLFRYDTDFR